MKKSDAALNIDKRREEIKRLQYIMNEASDIIDRFQLPHFIIYGDLKDASEFHCTCRIDNIQLYSILKKTLKDCEWAENARNTVMNHFSELEEAIKQCAVSAEDVMKVTKEYGEALNAVPPYSWPDRNKNKILCICKYIILAIALCFAIFIFFYIGYIINIK